MKFIRNAGGDRAIDRLTPARAGGVARIATSELSVFGVQALGNAIGTDGEVRVISSPEAAIMPGLLGEVADRARRNSLAARHAAITASRWLSRGEVRLAPRRLPQSLVTVDGTQTAMAMVGGCALTTDGLGLAPTQPLSLTQLAEGEEISGLIAWFEDQWRSLEGSVEGKLRLDALFDNISRPRSAAEVYHHVLNSLFTEMGEALDEERIVKTATGIKDSIVWSKLYRFQRDGVVGAIDKLQRYGGCILADSVGLGKTFEALAVIKYHELRNDRVLVLCPKRLRDNWTLWRMNDRRNILAADRFGYDVLNHTDLSRDEGRSGDIDLSHVNWGNYDLVVIDESHNFRNRSSHSDRETRYDRLMRQIIKSGVKTRVLMLSEPLRFIFSHSALREGWDNPNVFQICALREMGGETERRQTVGRGLRLCVDKNGDRRRDEGLNVLTVIAGESYAAFAEGLQTQIEQDLGIRFGVVAPESFADLSYEAENGELAPLGAEQSAALTAWLKSEGFVAPNGKIDDSLRRALKSGTLTLPEAFHAVAIQAKELLAKLAGKLDVRDAGDRRPIPLNREIYLGADFKDLWDRIRPHVRDGAPTGRWVVDIPSGFTLSGKRERPLVEDELAARQMKARIEGGNLLVDTTSVAPIVTLARLTQFWWEDEMAKVRSGKKKASSLLTNLHQLEPVTAYLGDLDLKNLNARHLQDYQGHRRTQGMQPETINSEMGTFVQVEKWAVETGWLEKVVTTTRVPVPPKRHDVLTEEEYRRVMVQGSLSPPCLAR